MDENFWIKIDFLRTDDADLMDAGEGWDVTFNFVVEGVLLLLVAVPFFAFPLREDVNPSRSRSLRPRPLGQS